jgi:hypothetical protein
MTRPRSWTDDDLRRVAATSRSQREIYTRLGLRQTGGAHRDVTRAARRLGNNLPIGWPPGSNRSWSDDDLRRAVLGPPPAGSLAEVARRLGLSPSGQGNQVLRRNARRLRITLPDGRPLLVRR